jgi:NAD(P)H-hydrate epimerase
MIAGMLAQHPKEPDRAVAAAVYLHGRSGQLGAEDIGDPCFLATDIFSYLPEAMRECADLSNGL